MVVTTARVGDAAGLRAPSAASAEARRGLHRRPRAILFDLDGTLYAQAPLRGLMGAELISRSLRRGWRELSVLQEFRRQGERLRTGASAGRPASLARQQLMDTAARVGWDVERVERLVREWMQTRPLKYLRICRRGGLLPLLDMLRDRGLPAGILSDYPVAEKLRALGLAGRFSPALCTTDPEINALKPHPRGFERACAIWGLRPEEVLYVGDRPDVDAVGARNAGMDFWLVSSMPSSGFGRLLRLLKAHA